MLRRRDSDGASAGASGGASPGVFQIHQQVFAIGDDFWIANARAGHDVALVLAVAIVVDQISHPMR